MAREQPAAASLAETGQIGCRVLPFGSVPTFFRFKPGVMALFGPNGSGKSKTLAAIRTAMGGAAPPSHHQRGQQHSDLKSADQVRYCGPPSGGGLFEDRVDSVAPADFWDDEDLDDSDHEAHTRAGILRHRRWSSDQWAKELDFGSAFNNRSLPVELARAIAKEKLYAINAAGDIAVCASRDSSDSRIAQAIDDTTTALRRYFGADGRDIGSGFVWEAAVGDPDLEELFRSAPLFRDFAHVEQTEHLLAQHPWVPFEFEWIQPDYILDRSLDVADVDGIDISAVALFGDLPVSAVDECLDEASALASEFLSWIFEDAPKVERKKAWNETTTVDFAHGFSILDHHLVKTYTLHRDGSEPYTFPRNGILEIDAFSDTQQRFIRLAVLVASHLVAPSFRDEGWKRDPGSLTVFIDEPERGIAPRNQKRLATALSRMSKVHGVNFVISTHSGAMLADPEIHLYRVDRQPNTENLEVTITEVDEFTRNRLQAVGVPQDELPHLFETFLIVEGEQDVWVIDELVGAELERQRVKMIPVFGASNMPKFFAADAGFLFEHFPDANFVFACDAARNELLQQMHAVAVNSATGDIKSALDSHLYGKQLSEEENVFRTLLNRAAETDRFDRLTGLFGFSAADIIEYLQVDRIVPSGGSWEELRHAHAEQRVEKPTKSAKDFKKWLSMEHESRFDEASLRLAVPQDHVPQEFLDLVKLCRREPEDETN
jgi:hypothetical protein